MDTATPNTTTTTTTDNSRTTLASTATAAAAPAPEQDPLETAKWTQYLPETFGLRESVRASSYRWCVRESGMWGIGTATAMGLHRWRMGSKPIWVGHSFFGTVMFVMMPSYYFCYRRREHHEQVIESMMQYNQFGHAKTDLPPEPPLEEHPFWEQQDYADQYNNPDDPTTATTTPTPTKHDREFRGMIKEQKEWQKKANPSMEDIFQEKK